MKLHKPHPNCSFKSYPTGSITQFFGENVPLYSKICPLPGSCMVGGHNGVDSVAPWGTPIFTVCDGIVADVKYDSGGYGKHVRILSDTDEWTYGHLSEINVVLGQQVVAGQVIGKMGNTGFVVSGATPYWEFNPYAGTHLHFGRRPIQKVSGIEQSDIQYANGQRAKLPFYNNGTFGYVAITAEDFEDSVETPPTQTLDMTLQSLENNALQAEAEGKPQMASIIRAIKGVVKAFWK